MACLPVVIHGIAITLAHAGYNLGDGAGSAKQAVGGLGIDPGALYHRDSPAFRRRSIRARLGPAKGTPEKLPLNKGGRQ